MSDTREVLVRLKRRMGRERGRFVRMHNSTGSQMQKERCHYEITMIGLCTGFVDDELRKHDEAAAAARSGGRDG